MLTMSPARRLSSAGLPAPSMRIRSARGRSTRALEHVGHQAGLVWIVARGGGRKTRPWTMTCARISACGLSRTGFICTVGSLPAARACVACARPISPPSGVTAALLLMFCDLNGADVQPAPGEARHNAVTSSDLPTFEPVPCSIRAAVFAVAI